MTSATPTAADLLIAFIAAATEALLSGSSCVTVGDLDVSMVSDRIAVCGEGNRRARTLKSVFDTFSRASGITVTTGADKWEDHEDGIYTCVWIAV